MARCSKQLERTFHKPKHRSAGSLQDGTGHQHDTQSRLNLKKREKGRYGVVPVQSYSTTPSDTAQLQDPEMSLLKTRITDTLQKQERLTTFKHQDYVQMTRSDKDEVPNSLSNEQLLNGLDGTTSCSGRYWLYKQVACTHVYAMDWSRRPLCTKHTKYKIPN